MAPFSNAWDETKPAGTDAIALGDDQIRQLKLDLRERFNVEHDFPSASGNLRHKFPRGTTAARNAITDWVVGSIYFNTDAFAGFTTIQIVTAVGPVTWINVAVLDHGSLTGLADDDHTQYILVAGTRAFTANQDLGGFKITGSATPSADNDLARKKYVDDQITANVPAVGARGQASANDAVSPGGSFADVPNMSVTVTTNGKPVLITAHVNLTTASGVNNGLDLALDIDGVTKVLVSAQGPASNGLLATIAWLEIGLSAASHTFKLRWRSIGSGGATPAQTANRVISVVEQTQVST